MKREGVIETLDVFFPNRKASQKELACCLGVTRQRIQQIRREYGLEDRISGREDHKTEEKKCCGCGFIMEISEHEKDKRKFCSPECFIEYRKKNGSVTVKCSGCGKEFVMRKSLYLRGKDTHKVGFFCSRQCLGQHIGKKYGFKEKVTNG